MDIKETGKKLKPFAPVLSVALVTACVAGSLSGYEAPAYAATQEETPAKKEETKEKKEEKKTAAKGSFDLEDGVYKGTGTGYAGDITVSVLIKDKQIVSIDILSSSDDAAFFTRAKAVIDKIIEGQTLDVDTVSGATFSSRGIISAVKNALTGEKDTSETGQAQSGQTGAAAGSSTSVAQVEDAAAYKDGTYYGSGTGFGGPLKVMVEISGGKIASIQIVENSDGSDYISKAASLIDSIITTQSTNVDTVSGATYSSVGIIQAVRDALGQATVNGTSDSTQNNNNNSNNNSSSDDDALFESASYSYYTLSDTPSYYKEATVNEDGNLSFSEVKGEGPTTLTNAKTEFSTSSKYGDYQLDITSEDLKNVNTVYGVVVSTKEGSSYGLRHVENIWKKTKLAWSTGFVTESHGNTLDSKDYVAMMGQTINKVTYYTDQGIYEIPMDQQVAKKFDGEVSVADVSVKSEKTAITVSGLPNDFEEEYKIDGIDEDAYSVEIKSDGKTTTRTINFKKALAKGRYAVTLSDRNGNYVPISTTFNVYTETTPVKYNENDKDPAVVKADGVDEEEFQTYLKNITSVTVNGKEYAASGKKAVKLITEDGKLDLSQDAFKDAKAGDAFAVTIAEDGYQPYTFTYKVSGEDSEYSYVYVGMSWAEYWANEGVYNAGSIEASDVKD